MGNAVYRVGMQAICSLVLMLVVLEYMIRKLVRRH
jgi:hypothetical protein